MQHLEEHKNDMITLIFTQQVHGTRQIEDHMNGVP